MPSSTVARLTALALVLAASLAGCTTPGPAPSAPRAEAAATGGVSAAAEARERAYFRRTLVKYAFDVYGRGVRLPDEFILDPATAVAQYRAAGGAPSATWIGHSTFLVELAGTHILTDPIYARYATPMAPFGPRRLAPPGLPFPALPRVDVVLVSHSHYDHFDLPTLRALAARGPDTVVVGPRDPTVQRLLRRVGFRRIVLIGPTEEVELGNIRVRAVPAQHNSGRGLDNDRPPHAVGYVIEGGGLKLYFAGDTGYGPAVREAGRAFGPVDAAFVPIGAYSPQDIYYIYHVNPEDALKLARDFGADAAIAMHWGTFALSPEPILEPRRRFLAAPSFGVEKIVPKIGETILLPCSACGS